MASGRMALGNAKSGWNIDPTLRPDLRLAFRRPGRQTHGAHRPPGIIFADVDEPNETTIATDSGWGYQGERNGCLNGCTSLATDKSGDTSLDPTNNKNKTLPNIPRSSIILRSMPYSVPTPGCLVTTGMKHTIKPNTRYLIPYL